MQNILYFLDEGDCFCARGRMLLLFESVVVDSENQREKMC